MHGNLQQSQTTQRSGRSISGTATGSPVAVNNGLNPAWRDSIIHFIANEAYPTDVSSEVADAVTSDMSETAYKLRQLAPDSGAYINEVSASLQWHGDKIDMTDISFSSAAPSSLTSRRLCTATTTPASSRSSTRSTPRACSGVTSALPATSGTQERMVGSARGAGLEWTPVTNNRTAFAMSTRITAGQEEIESYR